MGETDQEAEVICIKNQMEICGRVEITFPEIFTALCFVHFNLCRDRTWPCGFPCSLFALCDHHCASQQQHCMLRQPSSSTSYTPCTWGHTRTKNTSPHSSWEVNVYCLALHSTLTHLHNPFILPNVPLCSIRTWFLYNPNRKFQWFSNPTTAPRNQKQFSNSSNWVLFDMNCLMNTRKNCFY